MAKTSASCGWELHLDLALDGRDVPSAARANHIDHRRRRLQPPKTDSDAAGGHRHGPQSRRIEVVEADGPDRDLWGWPARRGYRPRRGCHEARFLRKARKAVPTQRSPHARATTPAILSSTVARAEGRTSIAPTMATTLPEIANRHRL